MSGRDSGGARLTRYAFCRFRLGSGVYGGAVSGDRLDTAHEIWDQWWGDAKKREYWSQADPAVSGFIPALSARGAHKVLDVGAGIGRHSLAYARSGFEVLAVDASETGLDEVRRLGKSEGLEVEVRVALFTELPVDDASVDHVLAWNVLYHGDGDVTAASFRECRRVLRNDGTFQLTMLSKRNRAYGIGVEIRPDTFVDETSIGDKEHPHFYADAAAASRMLAESGFEVFSMQDVDQQPPGGFHWSIIAEVR
jgi:tellurite methyltransferase